MRGKEVSLWEERLKAVFDKIDAELEAEYGADYPLHPSRPKHGTTANPEDDGLFNIGAAFSAGYGSEHGPGYVVEIRFSTLHTVPQNIRTKIKEEVYQRLKTRLSEAFPERTLQVSEENSIIRIHGDLRLANGTTR